MDVIHFTLGATGARFLPLADGQGNSHLSCLHLEKERKASSPSLTHAGMGAVFDKNEAYFLKSEEDPILVIFESQVLTVHARAISTPQRIAGPLSPLKKPQVICIGSRIPKGSC